MNMAASIGKDFKKGLKVLTSGAGEIAEKAIKETEKLGLKIQVDNIKKEIRSSYRDLGIISFEKIINGEKDFHKDEEIKKIVDEIHKNSLKKKMLLAEEEI